MPEITIEPVAILPPPSRAVSFAVPHKEPNSTKRTSMERGRISLHIDSLDLKKYQLASDASISIFVLYSGQGGAENTKFQTPFLDVSKAQQDTLTWSENFTLTDLRPNLGNSQICFEMVISTKNRFLVPKKTIIGRSEALPLDFLLGYSDEAEISFTMSPVGSLLSPILRIKTRRLPPVPVNTKMIRP